MSVCECHFLLVCVFLFYKMCIDRCVCVYVLISATLVISLFVVTKQLSFLNK